MEAHISVLPPIDGNDGEIWVKLLSGIPPYKVEISPPVKGKKKARAYLPKTRTFTLAYRWKNLAEGEYRVTVRDSIGQIYQESLVV